MAEYDPFAGIPNAGGEEDARLDEVFGPLSGTSGGRAGYDIIDRAGQAEYYLREAGRAGLPLPAYVTISAHDHGGWRSSYIGIQLTSTDDVGLWALHFGVMPEITGRGAHAVLGDDQPHHRVDAYHMFPEPAEVPGPAEQMTDGRFADVMQAAVDNTPHPDLAPPVPSPADNLRASLAEHTQAACDAITRAAEC